MFSNSQQSWEKKGKAKRPGRLPATQHSHLCPLGWVGGREAGVLEAWCLETYPKFYCWFEF